MGLLRSKVARILLVVLIGLVLPALGAAQDGAAKADEPPVDMQWGVKIPMRDGVQLNATVYLPHANSERLPVIFTFTPYIGDSYTPRAMYFARHGYVYALVDVRGRGNSGGSFEPFVSEGRDGYDVVEWFARQSYCDGKVAVWGGSYAGFDQWTTLKEFPPHLATIVPAAAAHPGVDFPFQYNIFGPYAMQWLTFTSGVTGNEQTFQNGIFWTEKSREMFREHTAFRKYDSLVGNPSPTFQKWLAHPIPDAYYDAMVPTPEEYRRITQPILTITGDYDGDQPGAFTYYKRHMQYGNAEAKANHYLIIGPWDHAGTRTPKNEVGGLKFGDASMLDLNKLHAEWYGWTMKHGAKPDFLKKRVAYYVTGAEEWKYADSLESISNATHTLYLSSDGSANGVFHSGRLTEKPLSGAAADSWTYDPLNVRALELATDPDEPYVTSQRPLMDLNGEGVIYHSDLLPAVLEISGFPKLTVWLSMDVPDTDLVVVLYEVKPSGESVMLTSATMRTRYRDSLRDAKPVPLNEPVKYVFDDFTFFSRRLAKGSRIRLAIASLNTPDSEKNYNSGGVVADETAKNARTAHIRLLHDAVHPGTLELPVVQ